MKTIKCSVCDLLVFEEDWNEEKNCCRFCEE